MATKMTEPARLASTLERVPASTPMSGPLGIICGGGAVPIAVAEAVARRGRQVVLFALRGWGDTHAVDRYPHHWIALGQFDRFCRLARAEGCRDIVLVGTLVRPALRDVRLDWGTVMRLPKIIRSLRGGDDHLLSGIARILESDGFRLIGAHEIAPEITAPPGLLGRHRPDAGTEEDIDRGFAVLRAIGPFDVGQAVVVAGGHVLAVEAAEGTDGMLERVAALRERGRIGSGAGVLVKAPKSRQDRRFDLPSIGPDTIARAAAAGLAGVAVIAGATILAEPQRMIAAADRAGLFALARPEADAHR